MSENILFAAAAFVEVACGIFKTAISDATAYAVAHEILVGHKIMAIKQIRKWGGVEPAFPKLADKSGRPHLGTAKDIVTHAERMITVFKDYS